MAKRIKGKSTPPDTSGRQTPRAVKSGMSRNTKLVMLVLSIGLGIYLTDRNWLGTLDFLWPGNQVPEEADGSKTPFPAFTRQTQHEEVAFSDFLGSEACASCHPKEYDLWKGSTHGQAGGDPTPANVIGKFEGQSLAFRDATVRPLRKNGQYVFQFFPKNLPAQEFQVDAVVGGGHMIGGGSQTYFSEFPDGTLRFLPFDFIKKEQVWFGETNRNKGWIPITEGLSMHDLSEFPPSRVLGAHAYLDNCQQCHGSQIEVSFNREAKKYDTKYVSLSINCESCHGPGKKHVDLMRSGRPDTLTDIGMPALATLSKNASLQVCFQCHALKDGLQPGFLNGEALDDYYSTKLPILGGNPYHPDGRIKAFGYQQNHLASACYIDGSMTCVDCHDPHSQGYRDIFGKTLASPFDDGQCTDCHPSKGLNPTAHSKHAADSPGNNCVNCHMPYLQHQAMGDQLRFARSDHSIPIPRPAFDAAQGIESSCQKCHRDKSIDDLEATMQEWYGTIKPHNPTVARLYEAEKAENLDRRSAGELLLDGSTRHPIAGMSGLSRFVSDYLSPNMPELEPEIVAKIKQFAENPDKDLRSLALASLHLAQDQKPVIRRYLSDQLAALGADETAIRKRWATALPYIAKQYQDKGNINDAILTYKKALEIDPGKPAILVNLGYAHELKGEFSVAIQYYQKALESDSDDAMVWVNIGVVQEKLNNMEAAVAAYQQALEINPWNPLAHFNLGNHYYRTENLPRAIDYYKKAISLNPALAQAYFNLTRSYIKAQQYEKALEAVKGGLQFEPGDDMGIQMQADLKVYFGL